MNFLKAQLNSIYTITLILSGLIASPGFSFLDSPELQIKKQEYLQGSIIPENLAGDAEVIKIGKLRVEHKHSHFPDFLSDSDLAFLVDQVRWAQEGQDSQLINLGQSRDSLLKESWGDFAKVEDMVQVMEGKYKLDFYLARDMHGSVYQAFDVIGKNGESAAFRMKTPLTGTRKIHVRSNHKDRVVRILELPVQKKLTKYQGQKAKEALGLSKVIQWKSPEYLIAFSHMHYAHRTKRKWMLRGGKVGMGALSGLFIFLSYKALFRKMDDLKQTIKHGHVHHHKGSKHKVKHGHKKHAHKHHDHHHDHGHAHKKGQSCSSSGCGHKHHAPKKGHSHSHKKVTQQDKNKFYFFKYFDAAVFGSAAIAWGAHALDIHERLEDMEESPTKAMLERSFHLIELIAVGLGLTKGALALPHLFVPKNWMHKDTLRFLNIANMSASDLHAIAMISTFLTCPFDEMLGMVLAFVGGAFDKHKFNEVWHRDHDHHLPAIVHLHL